MPDSSSPGGVSPWIGQSSPAASKALRHRAASGALAVQQLAKLHQKSASKIALLANSGDSLNGDCPCSFWLSDSSGEAGLDEHIMHAHCLLLNLLQASPCSSLSVSMSKAPLREEYHTWTQTLDRGVSNHPSTRGGTSAASARAAAASALAISTTIAWGPKLL